MKKSSPSPRGAPRGNALRRREVPAVARRTSTARGRPKAASGSSAHEDLLNAAEALMLDEGYAAVTSRRVAAKAGVDAALVYYYFGTMDDLAIALFQRNAQLRAEGLKEALASPQPLWALWDALREPSSTALMNEFIALANHRKAVKSVMVQSSRKFRRTQLERLSGVLKRYGVDSEMWPPVAIIVLLSSISRHLRTDESFGVELGRDETIALVERQIRALEGERRERHDEGEEGSTRGGSSSAATARRRRSSRSVETLRPLRTEA
jgi:AcrR family transcriptional regulator